MLRQLVYRPVVPLAGYILEGVERRRYLMCVLRGPGCSQDIQD